jgi:transposase
MMKLMGKSRKKYSQEFKLEAVKQVVEQGRTVASVAEGLGVNPGLLSRWKKELATAGSTAFPGNGNPNSADDEMRQLRKELATARQERDILKKALGFFASHKS